MDLLINYDWPGNVRQLEHELERAAIVCGQDNVIDLDDLSSELIIYANSFPGASTTKGKLKDIIERVERDLIALSLAENQWNIMKTSKILGLTRKGLKDKISRHKIKPKNDQ
jgi:transcriptional regulator with PAS, ATPase and Fis domain